MNKKIIFAALIPAIIFVTGCDDASKEKTEASIEQAKDKAADLKDKTGAKASELSGSAKEQWHDTKDKAADLKDKVDAKASELSGSAKEQ